MASTLLNLPDIPAVTLPDDRLKLHRKVFVGKEKKELFGGIDKDCVKTIMKNSLYDLQDFFLSANSSFQSITASSIKKQCKELRYEIQ